jgi:hypothetical protein
MKLSQNRKLLRVDPISCACDLAFRFVSSSSLLASLLCSRFYLINWPLACRLCIFNKGLAMFVCKWQVSGNSETLSNRLAGSLGVQFLSTGTKSNCRDLFDLYSFASYRHSLAYALSLAFLSFPLSFCSGTTWFPLPSDTT